MTSLSKILSGMFKGASALALSGTTASATVVCAANVCWHTHEVYEYPPEAHVTIYPDDWHWGAREHFAWREHRGRGYWDGDDWVDF
jgi:hypothetical protein